MPAMHGRGPLGLQRARLSAAAVRPAPPPLLWDHAAMAGAQAVLGRRVADGAARAVGISTRGERGTVRVADAVHLQALVGAVSARGTAAPVARVGGAVADDSLGRAAVGDVRIALSNEEA